MTERALRGTSRTTALRLLFVVLAVLGPSSGPCSAGPPDPEELRPGVVATHEDGAKPPTRFHELAPTVALALGPKEAAHPRLALGGGRARWEGYLNILRPGVYRFSAQLRGRFRLRIGPAAVLEAEVQGPAPELRTGPEVRLEAGLHPLSAEFTRFPGAARVELFWEGPHFRKEPLPYDHLRHRPDQEPPGLAGDRLAEHGRFLAEEHACVRCHRAAEEDGSARGLESRQGPDLSEVGRRVYAGWIYRWLESPQRLRPEAIMPALFAADPEGGVKRYAVARHLASLGGPFRPANQPADGGDLRASIDRGSRLFAGVGCAACHHEEKRAEKGEGRKHAASSLFPLMPLPLELGNLRGKTTTEQLAAYLLDPLAVDPSGRMPHMLLQADEARDLARYLCREPGAAEEADLPRPPPPESIRSAFRRFEQRADERAAFERLTADAQILELGKRLVLEKGCNNCHTIAPRGKPFANVLAQTTFEEIKQPGRLASGCLAEEPPLGGQAPHFAFGASERRALRHFLQSGADGAGSPAPAHTARVVLQRFGCLVCHARDGEGGLSPALVDGLRRVERADNSEAVTPPPLTGVAHKLRTPWMQQVLTQAARARPWMSLRMPQFGAANVRRLPEMLAALEGTKPQERVHEVAVTAAKVAAGRRLVGKGALGCISCHDIAGIANAGTRGPDLASMSQRVRYDWYRRWLEQAQRMQPGTRMPSAFADGKSLVTSLFAGDADAQAEAIWAYLSLGRDLPLPEGVEAPRGIVLAARDRPVLLRTFLPDVGPRALAVGYPDGLSVAFDAALCRLAYAWTGPFLDAAPVWTERGGNPAGVLGTRFWTAPPGCPWALTLSSEVLDFAASASDPALGAPLAEGQYHPGPRRLQFEGYSVDGAGRPTFHYRILGEHGQVDISERPEPLHAGNLTGLARHFTLHLPAARTAWFCAGRSAHRPHVLDGILPSAKRTTSDVELVQADRLLALPQDEKCAVVLRIIAAPPEAVWRVHQRKDAWEVLLQLPSLAKSAPVQASVQAWAFDRVTPERLSALPPAK
jgi:cytochrome c551/c552/mono/diheme cytochrome c family protein